ncbi:MAG: nuclear transport factor 2 family protein [Solirubrobacterales bacterium]|nr:nuclear transport factor 2 family protein [Solirubrobacterales bacterium]
MSRANIEIARRGYAAAARGDLDAIRDLLDPNVKWHGGDPTAPGACRNRDEAFQFMRQAHGRARSGSWSRSSTPAIAWS